MSSDALHLVVATPARILVDSTGIVALRAEDQSGSFGIMPGHADLLTVLVPSVLRWRTAGGATRFCAVHGGVFTVSAGRDVAVACREGVVGESLAELEAKVHALREQERETERKSRVEQLRQHALAVRQLLRYLRPGPAAETPFQREAAP